MFKDMTTGYRVSGDENTGTKCAQEEAWRTGMGEEVDSSTTEIRRAIGFVVFAGLALLVLGIPIVSVFAQNHQSFVAGLIGSLIGTAAAFAGAGWIWSVERKAVVQERIADRRQQRGDDLQRHDEESIRKLLYLLGDLQALNYHLINEERFATAREKYQAHLRIAEIAASAKDPQLREELSVIQQLVEDDDVTTAFLGLYEGERIRMAVEWLRRLASLDETLGPAAARPSNYEKIHKGFEDIDEHYQEQAEMQREYEEAERAAADNARKSG